MGKITTPRHTLVFGSITMIERGANPPDESGCLYIVQGQDTTFGSPTPVTQALLTLMRAGNTVTYDRTDNREPVLRVTIRGSNSNVLALGERALQLECEKPNTLTWIPPDDAGEPSVFDIVWSSLELVMDDQAELRRERTYLVHLQALPYAREATKVVTPAEPTAAETPVDDGSSVTGWTASPGAVASTAGAIVETYTLPLTLGVSPALTRTGTVTLTGQRYVAVTWKTTDTSVKGVVARLPDYKIEEAVRVDAGSGWSTSWFLLPDGLASVPTLAFFLARTEFGGAGSVTFSIDKVSLWTALPYIGTSRQKAMSLEPGGSVHAGGSIQVAHATSALGKKVVVYIHPSGTGYLPPLSPWRTSGDTRNADSSLLSGAHATLTGVTTFQVPVSALPRGRVEVWAWLSASAATPFTLFWSLFSYMGSTALSSDARSSLLTLPTGYQLVCLGSATMPPVDLGPSGYVAVQMQRDGGSALTINWDEVYLFATDLGRLTVVDCGTGSPAAGGPSNRLWVDAPSLEQPNGGLWRGNAADRSDAWHAGAKADVWEIHELDPAGVSVFVATQEALDAQTSLDHYRRYHTHVARDL